MEFLVVLVLVLLTSVWVYSDASDIGVKKGQLTGVCDMGPGGWFLACLGLWIISFPLYLINRGELKRINLSNKYGALAAPPVVTPPPWSPPPTAPALEQDFDDQLRKLAKLKQEGVISEEDFNQKKKSLLGLCVSLPPAIIQKETLVDSSSAPPVALPSFTSSKQEPTNTGITVVAIIALIFVCLFPYLWGLSNKPVTSPSPARISRAQWREKAFPYYNATGRRTITTVSNFKAVVGQPSHTQVVGSAQREYWYYYCSDGTVEVDLVDPRLTGGQLAINSVSEY